MSALDYRTIIQPSGTLRLTSHDDHHVHELSRYKAQRLNWGQWARALIGLRPEAVPSVVTDRPYHFPIIGPDHHAIPVVTDVPGHTPIAGLGLDTQSISDRLRPNDAHIISTNQSPGMQGKLPVQTVIHLSNPTPVPMPTIVPHDGMPLTELQKRVHMDTIIPAIWKLLQDTFGYVVWNYEDLYRQLSTWDGNVLSLFRDVHFVWRVVVSSVLALGILEIVPLLEILFHLWWDFMELVYSTFRYLGTVINEAIHFIMILWDDADAMWFRLTGR